MNNSTTFVVCIPCETDKEVEQLMGRLTVEMLKRTIEANEHRDIPSAIIAVKAMVRKRGYFSALKNLAQGKPCSTKTDVRIAAIRALGRCRGKPLKTLKEIVLNPGPLPRVKLAAIEEIGKLKTRRAREFLEEMLIHCDRYEDINRDLGPLVRKLTGKRTVGKPIKPSSRKKQ